jgi:5,5'-dehydrodivanillate O-demethylase oxygenase subunit
VQDYTAQVGQGAIPDRTIEHMGRSDVGVILLRRIWERELRALAEDRPLKQWTQREDVEATTGLAVVS